MKTLLQPGDKIHIRSDIKQAQWYSMKTTEVRDSWIRANMAKPGQLVTIRRVLHGRYQIEEDRLCSYTDEMFEPDLIEFLYQDYLNNK
jgi:hypothetical protein